MTKIFELTISKTGIPCLWEAGGGYTNTGSATIIAGKDGLPLRPIYIRERGSLACENHALIPVGVGSFVIEAQHHRRDFSVSIWRIKQINGKTAKAEMIGEYSLGEWVFSQEPHPEVADHLRAAIEAAQEKATCYHCREPHYIMKEA